MIERETGVKSENLRDIWMVTDALICEVRHFWQYGRYCW